MFHYFSTYRRSQLKRNFHSFYISNVPTLLRAIAQAGGFSERASKGRVVIKRIGEDGKEQQTKANCKDILAGKKKDIQLQENDVVYVPETIF